MKELSKKSLRQEMNSRLKRLEPDWILSAATALCQNLSDLFAGEFDSTCTDILAWKAFFPGEVDLSDFINRRVNLNRVFFPRTTPDLEICFKQIGQNWREELQPGGYNIPEPPIENSAYDPAKGSSTIALIPGLAFTSKGARLGRGGGCYDRFFANEKTRSIVKIGVCWSLQLSSEIPTDQYDLPVDWICTEKGFLPAA